MFLKAGHKTLCGRNLLCFTFTCAFSNQGGYISVRGREMLILIAPHGRVVSDFCLFYTFVWFFTLVMYYFLTKEKKKKKHFNFKFHIGEGLIKKPELILCGHGGCLWVPLLSMFLSKLVTSLSRSTSTCCLLCLCPEGTPPMSS